MSLDRDVVAFDRRADRYESGRLGRWHAHIVDRSVDVILAVAPVPLRVLDVGCGTGALLRELSIRLPTALELVGVDPAESMLRVARRRSDGRVRFRSGAAEQLPLGDGYFDLVVSTLSFDHWADQRAGLAELARVLAPDGRLVLVDLCAGWRRLTARSGRARTPRELGRLVAEAGLRVRHRETLYRVGPAPLVRAFLVSR